MLMISKKTYDNLIKRKKKKLSKKKNDKLDRALFINYCKCIKKIKYSKKYATFRISYMYQ